MAPKKEKSATIDCKVLSPVMLDGDRYEAGETIPLAANEAQELAACGAVELPAIAAEPAPAE